LRRWDTATGKPLYADVSALGHTGAVRRLFFLPDGKRLLSVGEDGSLRGWDVAGSRLLFTRGLDRATYDAWALAPGGKTLVAVDDRLPVRRWATADGRLLGSCLLREADRLDIGLRARHVAVGADGKTLVLSAWPRLVDYENFK